MSAVPVPPATPADAWSLTLETTDEAALAAHREATFARFGPVLAISVTACELLWQIAHKQPVLAELRRRTGLNPRLFQVFHAADTALKFEETRNSLLAPYYYAHLVGRLVLEGPLRPMLRVILAYLPGTSFEAVASSVVATIQYLTPLLERGLIGQPNATPTAPLPLDDAQRAALEGWEARRKSLEEYFRSAAPELTHIVALLLPSIRAAQARREGPAAAPAADRRGPFLRRTFTDDELAALRLLLTYVPTFATLLPQQPFALAMRSLSALHAPQVADLLQRLRAIKPGQPLHFTLADSLTLLQTLQSGALMLLRASSGDLVRALRRHADDPDEPDEDLRRERGRVLFLLADGATRTQFRAVFTPLLKTFSAAVDRTYPHHPALTKARTELAALAAVR